MGMALAVIFIAHLFLDLGFNRAIIQQPNVSDLEYSTVFYINVAIAFVMAAGCFFAAAPLSRFYAQPLIQPVFRVLSVTFLINGLNLVPSSILYKQLKFKLNSILNISSSIIGGVAGMAMAFAGFGVWSLVAQSLCTSIIVMLTNFIYARWWPNFSFSLESIKEMWRYGSRMFASGLLDAIFTKVDVFIIGRIFSTATLGYYTRAQSMDNLVRQLSVNSIMGALFPYIAKHQQDRPYLIQLFFRYLHIIAFVSIALSGTLFLVSIDIFTVLFTSKWHLAAELFQLMSIVGFAWPISSLMCSIIAGVGNSKTFLRLELYKKVLFLPVYMFGFIFGLKGFLWVYIAANFLGVTLNAVYLGKELTLSVTEQIKPIMKYFMVGCVSVTSSHYLLQLFDLNIVWGRIFVAAALYNLIFLFGNYVFKLEAIRNLYPITAKIYKSYNDKRNKNISATL